MNKLEGRVVLVMEADFILTRRRGGAEEDAEKMRREKSKAENGETAETRRPSCARIDRLKPVPPQRIRSFR
jgi:hypothetical protein